MLLPPVSSRFAEAADHPSLSEAGFSSEPLHHRPRSRHHCPHRSDRHAVQVAVADVKAVQLTGDGLKEGAAQL
jgi:hypothetical protein